MIARDGIDELLTGFLPRRVSRIRARQPTTIGVRCTDFDSAWLVQVGPRQPVTSRVAVDSAEVDDSDVLLGGPAVALYLTLWNRSDEVRPESGDEDWSWADAAVTWGRTD